MTNIDRPHPEFQAMVSRIALAAVYAEILIPAGDGLVRPAPSAGEYRLNDSGYADALIKRYPDGPNGQRWLMIGNDWDDPSPFQLAETPEAHLVAGAAGPGTPDWLGLRDARDLYELTRVDCPSIVTWFNDGRWHVSGARLDAIAHQDENARTKFAPFDEQRPWTDAQLEYICRPFLDDETTRQRVIALDIGSARDKELCSDEQMAELAARCWNAALEPATASDPRAFADHLRHLMRTITVRPVDESRVSTALIRLAAFRGMTWPQTLAPVASVAGALPAPVDQTAVRVAEIMTMITELGAVAAAEAAAGIPEEHRAVRLGWAGLFVQAPDHGWTLITGLDPMRLVAAGHNPAHPPMYRSGHAKHFAPRAESRYPTPTWIPRGLIEQATRNETTTLTWTIGGLWRGQGVGNVLRAPAYESIPIARALPVPKASWRPAARREAEAIMQAVHAFVTGNAVLAAGVPRAYPDIAPFEPLDQALERAASEARLRTEIEDWACVSALGLAFADLPSAPMPGAGQDPLAWGRARPELDVTARRQAVDALYEGVFTAIASRHEIAKPNRQRIRNGLMQIISGNHPTADPVDNLTRIAAELGAPLLPHRLDQARDVIRAAQAPVRAGRIA